MAQEQGKARRSAGAREGVEARRSERRPMEVQVRLTRPGHAPVTFLSHDLGAGGVFLRSQKPLPRGTLVGLSFQLPSVGRFSTLAEVAWSTTATGLSGRSGMGMRFAPFDRDELAPVVRYLDDDAERRRVLILEDDPKLREGLAASFERKGVQVLTASWLEADRALSASHGLLVVGVDKPGLAAQVVGRRPAPRRVALLGFEEAAPEWHPHTLFAFNKPVDPEQVARISLALFR